jgi:GrpB-like predicted nucleotidyltransferase (UPF0157 family)
MIDSTYLVIGPYELRPATCRDYDSRAATVAERVAECIASRLPGIRVEHIGSTSVPGCAGKGVVDLMIPVAAGEMDAAKKVLADLGFQPQPHRDPFPEDRPMRLGSVLHDGETFLLHVHVIPADSPEVDELRFFWACLRADPELRKVYVAKKREIIAGGATDSLDYCSEKRKFIKEVLGYP